MKKAIVVILTVVLIGEVLYLFTLTEKLKKLEQTPSMIGQNTDNTAKPNQTTTPGSIKIFSSKNKKKNGKN